MTAKGHCRLFSEPQPRGNCPRLCSELRPRVSCRRLAAGGPSFRARAGAMPAIISRQVQRKPVERFFTYASLGSIPVKWSRSRPLVHPSDQNTVCWLLPSYCASIERLSARRRKGSSVAAVAQVWSEAASCELGERGAGTLARHACLLGRDFFNPSRRESLRTPGLLEFHVSPFGQAAACPTSETDSCLLWDMRFSLRGLVQAIFPATPKLRRQLQEFGDSSRPAVPRRISALQTEVRDVGAGAQNRAA